MLNFWVYTTWFYPEVGGSGFFCQHYTAYKPKRSTSKPSP